MKKILFPGFLILCFSMIAFTQPRPMEKEAVTVKAKPAPPAFSAEYEGGVFGYNKKVTGTLKYDDANNRFVFYGPDEKELFQVPYDALLVIYPQSQSVTPTAGKVVSYIPLPGASLAGYIKSKRQYLVIQFSDPDVDVKGLVNFKIADKELLDSVIQTLAEKAKLQQRGDAYYRPKAVKPQSN